MHGQGKRKLAGQWLINLCSKIPLYIMNTMFITAVKESLHSEQQEQQNDSADFTCQQNPALHTG